MQRFSGVKVYDRRGDKWSDVTLCAFATGEQEEDNEDDDIVTTTPAAAGRSGCVLELMDEHGVFMMKYLMGTLRAAQAEHRSLHADPAKKTTTTTTASSSASLPSYAEDGSRQPRQRGPAEEGVVMHRGGGSSSVTSATVTRQTTPILSSSAGAASLMEGNSSSNAAAVRGVSAPSSLASSLLPHPGRLSRASSSSSSSSDDEQEDEGTMYCAERHDSVAGPAQRVPPRQRRSASHDMRANCFRLVLRTVTPRAARVPLSATLRLRLGLMPSATQRPAYSSHSAPRILYPLSRAPLRGQQCQTLRQTAEASTLVEGCAAVAMRAAEEGEGQTRGGQQSESLAQQHRGGQRCDATQRAMPQAVSLCDAVHRPWQRGYPSRTQAAAAACNKESVEDSGQGGVVIEEERRVSYAPFALPRSMPEPWCTAGRVADSQGPVTHSLKGRSATMRCGTPQTTTTTTTMMGHDGGKGGSAWSGVPTRGAYNFLAPLTSVEELYDVMLYGALSEPVSTAHQLQARQTSSRSSSESERRKGSTRTTRQASIDETTPSKAIARKKGAAAVQKDSFGSASRATLASSRHLLQDLLHLFHLPRRLPRPKTTNNNSNTTTQMATSANTSITNTTLSSTLPSPSSLHQCERRSSSASTTQTCPSQPAVEVYLTLRFDGEATLRRFLRECVQRMMPPPDVDPYVQADSHDDEESSLTSGSAEPYAMPEPPAGIVYCDKDAEGSEMDEQQSHTVACVARKPRMLRSTRSLQRELTRSQTLQSSYHRSIMNDDNTSTRQSWTEYFCYDTMPLRQPSSHVITAAHPHRHRHHSLTSSPAAASLQCADVPVYLWYAWRREAAKAYASCERGLLVIEAAVHGAHALLLQQEQPGSDAVPKSCEVARVGHTSMQSRRNAMARGGNSGEACMSSEHRKCTLQQLCAVVGRGGDKAVNDDTRGGDNDDDGVQEEAEKERRDRQATALSCPLTLPDSLHREGYATPQEGGEERSEETVRVVLQEAPHTRSARQRRLLVQQQYVAPLLGSNDTMGNRDSYNVITHNNNNKNMSAGDNEEEEDVGCGAQTAGPLLHPLLHRGAHFDDAFLCLTDTHLLFMNSFAEVVLHLTLDEVTLLVHSPTASHGFHRTRHTQAARSATAMREGGNSNNKKASRASNNTSKTARTDEGCNERQQQQCDDECLPFMSLLTRPGSNECDEPALLITFVLLPTIPPTPSLPATVIKGGGRMHDNAVLSSAQTIVMKDDHKSVVTDNGSVMGRSPPLASREYVAPQPREAYKANDTPTLTAQQGSSTAATKRGAILQQHQADYCDAAANALNERLETLLSRLTSRLPDVPCVTCTQAALCPPSSSMGSAAKAMSPSFTSASVGRTRRVDTARPASTASSDMSRALPAFLPPCLRQPRRCASYNVSDVELLWRLNAQPLPRYPILRADLYRAAHAIPALLSADSCSSSSSSSSLSLLPSAADTGHVAYEGQPHLNTRRRATQDARNTVATTTRPPAEDEYAIISPRRQRTVLIRRALFW